MIEKEYVESLGWKFDDFWNNRAMFSLNTNPIYSIFEHCGDWGIVDPFENSFVLLYCNMNKRMLDMFTKLAKNMDNIVNNPKEHTLYEFTEAHTKMIKFIKSMKDRS